MNRHDPGCAPFYFTGGEEFKLTLPRVSNIWVNSEKTFLSIWAIQLIFGLIIIPPANHSVPPADPDSGSEG